MIVVGVLIKALGRPDALPTEDKLVPPAWQYELAALIPDVQVVEVVGARHEVVWTHPDRVLDEIAGFLD